MSKPKSSRPPRSRPCPLDVLDEAARSCRKIAALAELLAHCEVERLKPSTLSLAAVLILDEIKNVRHHLKTLATAQ